MSKPNLSMLLLLLLAACTQPPEPTCVDKCGDGVCAEIVCMAIGCPCAESVVSCPQDCAEICTFTQDCSAGGCYKFPDIEVPICWEGDPCMRCPSGNCSIAESDPMQIFC